MPTIRDIRRNIRSVKGTQQITRAMKLMSTAKLGRAVDRLHAAHFYLAKLEQILTDLWEEADELPSHPLLQQRPALKASGIVLITGERGLCGSFNHDLIRMTMALLQKNPEIPKKLFLIGKKGHEFFRRKSWPILGYDPFLDGLFQSQEMALPVRNAISAYSSGQVDEIILVYVNFVSPMERYSVTHRLLPLTLEHPPERQKRQALLPIQFDPSPKQVLDAFIPRYVDGFFQRAVLETAAAEQAARMMAMGAATDRGEEMLDDLQLLFNRTRQAAITRELVEVTSGAEALNH
jgi:F-type H+-transporting ATPase subunit gamma